MTARRKHPASIEQHEVASAALLRAREAVQDAMRALGLLSPGSLGPGQACARETDALLKIERVIDRARCVCEERLASDHRGAWSTKTYYPGQR